MKKKILLLNWLRAYIGNKLVIKFFIWDDVMPVVKAECFLINFKWEIVLMIGNGITTIHLTLMFKDFIVPLDKYNDV